MFGLGIRGVFFRAGGKDSVAVAWGGLPDSAQVANRSGFRRLIFRRGGPSRRDVYFCRTLFAGPIERV
jgi:hypothetical protein